MSNTSLGLGDKGSKLWMGLYANSVGIRNLDPEWYKWVIKSGTWKLEKIENMPYNINNIEFLSPLSKHFEEYQLNNADIKKMLGLSKMKFNFWASRQPQWDGIAVDNVDAIKTADPEKINEIYLFEAKAHASEIELGESKNITNIRAMSDYFILPTTGKYYYQIINRLVFLYELKKFYENNKKVKLIFLNFYHDFTYHYEKLNKIKKEYEQAWNTLVSNPASPNKDDYSDVYVGFVKVD